MTPRGRGLPLQRDASIPFATSDGSELLVPAWRPEFEAATETLDRPRSTKKRWRPLEHELKDRLSPDYQAAVTRKASEFRIGTFTLVKDNSLRRIPAKGYVRVSRNRPLIARGLAKGDPSNPQITALGKRLIAELDRELGSDSYPVDALE